MLNREVKFVGPDIHKLRPALTGEVGTVRIVGRDHLTSPPRDVLFVEFHRDRHKPVSGGWWIDRANVVCVG